VTPLALYRGATVALAPLVLLYLMRRRARGKEDRARFGERLGRASRLRPPGPLLWLHAASVGEATSILSLVDRLARERPGLGLLVTTGTVTSAQLLEKRLPEPAIHQFVPVDRPAYVERFLDHWRPDLAIWIESELWPNLIQATRARDIPMVLLNARLSQRSFDRWRHVPETARTLLGCFDLCLAQDAAQAERLRSLGATAATVGDLKSAAAPLPADPAKLATLRAAIGTRPVWLAASTHPGEEDVAASVHRALAPRLPGLLTLLAPRHPKRADAIAAMLQRQGLSVARRSAGDELHVDIDVYLGDTLGEMGLLYRLSGIVFVGGSLTPVGGHNPLEPALLDCAILHGPDTTNCAAVARDLDAAGAARMVRDAAELAVEVERLIRGAAERDRMAASAQEVASRYRGVLDAVLERLAPFLDRLAATSDRDRACA
jgi:3-deoxy-D-manno-octulosonic-acid transferase